MRKYLVAVAVAALAIVAGPPALAEGVEFKPAYQVEQELVAAQDLGFTVHAVYRIGADKADVVDMTKVGDKNAGKKKNGEKEQATPTKGRTSTAEVLYPLRL